MPASDMERAVAALRDLTRRDILMGFYADPKPRTAEDVARSTGIHRSVAFDHLERLVGLGYLDTELRRGLVGKPAKLYRLTSGPVLLSHPPRRFDALARGFGHALEELGPPGYHAAREAGRRLGEELASRPAADLAGSLLQIAELGGDYEQTGDDALVARNCLFLEACSGRGAVCEFHAGLLEAVTGRAVDAEGRSGPFGCEYRLGEAAAGSRDSDRDELARPAAG